MSEIRDMRYLLALVQQGHFGRAAEALGVTQPALTMGLQRLEKQHGVRLLERGAGRTIKPTAFGRVVMERAERILGEYAAIDAELASLSGAVAGHVRIGTGPILAARTVPEAIGRLVAEHPKLTMEVIQGHWRDLTSDIVGGELDIFVGDISDAQNDSRMSILPFPEEDVLWTARREHPLAKRHRVTREELLSYPFVGPTLPPWAEAWFREGMAEMRKGQHSRSRVHAVESNDYGIIVRILDRSDAISGMTRAMIEDAEKLAALRVDAPVIRTHAGIVRYGEREHLPAMERVCEVMLEVAQATMG